MKKIINLYKNLIIRGKRGMSHIEIILSFVIFIGFTLFLFAIFNPFKIVKGGEVYLDTIERAIESNTSSEVIFQTLKLDENFNEQCFCFPYSFNSIIVKDEDYNITNATSNSNRVCVLRTDNKKFYYIYSSLEYIENNFNNAGCEDIDKGNYSLGLFRKYDFISFNKLNKLNKDTIENYEDTKKELGLPETKEFSFGIRNIESEEEFILNITKIPPRNTKVLARDVPIQIVYNNGNLKYAKLSILVW